MYSSNVKLSKSQQKRIDEFLTFFSKEAPAIREELANTVPAYNDLLSMHARTFEEFALLPIAKERKLNVEDPLFSYETICPPCPQCKEKNEIRKDDATTYICKKCKFKYTANWKSISSKSNCSSITWLKILKCMLNFCTIKETCRYCSITPTTFYQIRSRLFYGMELMLQDIKLFGNIQCDNTYVNISFKGYDLTDEYYPEDSPFEQKDFLPREARKRGGRYSLLEKNKNSLCLFTAIDEFGHVFAKNIGIGLPTAKKLLSGIPTDIFLSQIPKKDPFKFAKNSIPFDRVNEASLLLSDKEAAIISYAKHLDIEHKAYVFRRNNKQVKIYNSDHNIQRVNSLHSRLAEFLRKTHYVSSKYLPGYLIFFAFIENTDATTEAIAKLFEILSTPGMGKSSEFYKNKYSIPNYIVDFAADANALNKFPYTHLLATYLFDVLTNHPGKMPGLTIDDIIKKTGYSKSSIYRIHKNYCSAGLLDSIKKYFSDHKPPNDIVEKKEPNQRYTDINMQAVAIYKDYYNHLVECYETSSAPTPFKYFLIEENEKYGTDFKRTTLLFQFDKIEHLGEYGSLSEIKKQIEEAEFIKSRRVITYCEEIASLKNLYRKQGITVSDVAVISEVSKKLNMSEKVLSRYYLQYKKQIKQQSLKNKRTPKNRSSFVL